MSKLITLAGARVTAGLTQEELAVKMGVTRQTIIAWEKYKRAMRVPELIAFCSVTGFEQADIFIPAESTLSGDDDETEED